MMGKEEMSDNSCPDAPTRKMIMVISVPESQPYIKKIDIWNCNAANSPSDARSGHTVA